MDARVRGRPKSGVSARRGQLTCSTPRHFVLGMLRWVTAHCKQAQNNTRTLMVLGVYQKRKQQAVYAPGPAQRIIRATETTQTELISYGAVCALHIFYFLPLFPYFSVCSGRYS